MGPVTSRHTPKPTSARGYPTSSRLWRSSSSSHRSGTPAARASRKRCSSSVMCPSASAAAARTSATVFASSARAFPWLILPFPLPPSPIFLFLQPSIYAQLADRFAARVHRGVRHERRRLRPEPQLGQHRRHGERRRDRVTVLNLERDPVPFLRQQPAVHALGPDLHDDAAGVRAHHVGARPTLARDQLGMSQHHLEDNGVGGGGGDPTGRARPPPPAPPDPPPPPPPPTFLPPRPPPPPHRPAKHP